MDVRATLMAHYQDVFEGRCYCGASVPTYELWVDHIITTLTPGKTDEDIPTG
jgi:hypothetical protein